MHFWQLFKFDLKITDTVFGSVILTNINSKIIKIQWIRTHHSSFNVLFLCFTFGIRMEKGNSFTNDFITAINNKLKFIQHLKRYIAKYFNVIYLNYYD